jgi:uncharacterized protein (UPF0332 family)
MSPRSEELMAAARDRLGAAQAALGAGFHSNAASAAYYAMLYAARAALSEEDRNAKTHAGTWGLFRTQLVVAGHFDADLFSAAHGVQQLREAADYDAVMVPPEEAEHIVDLAGRFVEAVDAAIVT